MNVRAKRRYRKTIEALLYLANKDERLYWVLKMIWLAERNHLSKHGAMILGDDYIAMNHGPVPSLAYAIIQDVRREVGYGFEDPNPESVFETPDNRTITPMREANTSLLSQSELECLDDAYNSLKDRSFGAIKRFSHTPSYEAAGQNDGIPFEEFVSDLENGKEVLSYLKSI